MRGAHARAAVGSASEVELGHPHHMCFNMYLCFADCIDVPREIMSQDGVGILLLVLIWCEDSRPGIALPLVISSLVST